MSKLDRSAGKARAASGKVSPSPKKAKPASGVFGGSSGIQNARKNYPAGTAKPDGKRRTDERL